MKTDLKSIDSMIESIRTRGSVLRNDSHECLIAVLEHHMEHGDYSRLPKLIEAVKDSLGSSLSAAMITYAVKFYDGLIHDPENKSKKAKKENGYWVHVKVGGTIRDVKAEDKVQLKGKDKGVFFVGPARSLPYFQMEREVPQRAFDITDAFEKLIDRAKRALAANEDKDAPAHNLVNEKQIEALENVFKMLGNIGPDTELETETETKSEAPAEVVKNKGGRPRKTTAPEAVTEVTH